LDLLPSRSAGGLHPASAPGQWQLPGRFARSPTRRGLGQVFTDLRHELARAVGFGDVGIATRRTDLIGISRQTIGRDGDDRDRPQGRVGLDPAGGLVAVHDRELDVHKNEVRPMRTAAIV
jgi:hypothetical protein